MAGSAFKEADLSSIYNTTWNIFPETSSDIALDRSLEALRRKSQQLVRDNPIVATFQQVYINIISGGGPTIYCESENKIQERQANEYIESFLEAADITKTKSFNQLIEEKHSASFVDGDVLVNLPMDNGSTVIELIEAYRIKTPSELFRDPNIRHGVKYDNDGRILGYYVKKYDKLYQSTSDALTNFTFFHMFINGRMVTKLFKAPLNSRPTGSRQYPICTPIISKLKQFDDYHEALIVGARVSACFAVFIKTKNPAGTMKSMTTDAITGDVQRQTSDDKRYTKLQPGMIGYLKDGEEPMDMNPNKPGDNADAFIVRSLKIISAYFRVPYIVAFLDTDEVSFSSWKGANLEVNRMVNRWRRDENKDIKWICNTKLYEGIVNGKIRGNLEDINLKIRWPAVGLLDPEKESRGSRIALENQTTSRQSLCDIQGNDYEEIERELTAETIKIIERQAKEIKRKMELEKELGIVFPENKETENKKDEDALSGAKEGAVDQRKEDGNW
jgi:capsid protein